MHKTHTHTYTYSYYHCQSKMRSFFNQLKGAGKYYICHSRGLGNKAYPEDLGNIFRIWAHCFRGLRLGSEHHA